MIEELISAARACVCVCVCCLCCVCVVCMRTMSPTHRMGARVSKQSDNSNSNSKH